MHSKALQIILLIFITISPCTTFCTNEKITQQQKEESLWERQKRFLKENALSIIALGTAGFAIAYAIKTQQELRATIKDIQEIKKKNSTYDANFKTIDTNFKKTWLDIYQPKQK